MTDYLNNFRDRHRDELNTTQLDQRLIELSALFEISQTLNASLNLPSILNTILLVPMGRMMLSRGIILVSQPNQPFIIESLRGLPSDLAGSPVELSGLPDSPFLISEYGATDNRPKFFSEKRLELVLPVRSGRGIRVIVAFGPKLTGGKFSPDEIEFLHSLVNIALQAIENALTLGELSQVNEQLDHKVQELNTLFEIGKELNRLFEPAAILRQFSFALMGQLMVNQFVVLLREADQWQVAFRKGQIFAAFSPDQCDRFCRLLSQEKHPFRLTPGDESWQEIYNSGVRLIVPMEIQNANGGYILMASKLNNNNFSEANLSFISTLANMVMAALENARLIKEELEKQRLEEEITLAAGIQSRLLPREMPSIPGCLIHGVNIPSHQVGGDYYDILKISDERYLLAIADVSGKGMPAALLMSNLQAGLHALSTLNLELAEIVFRLNNLIYKNTSTEKYITAFFMLFEASSGRIEYVNAGHNPPYIFSSGTLKETLETGGIILGMMPDYRFETGYCTLHQHEILVMFTDGITEAMDADDHEFEERRVLSILQNNVSATPVELNQQLLGELRAFTGDVAQSDDITLVSMIKI